MASISRVEADRPAAEAGRNALEQRVGQRVLDRLDPVGLESGVQAADAARDVEADAARGDDAAASASNAATPPIGKP
jgi:hypothetical protein